MQLKLSFEITLFLIYIPIFIFSLIDPYSWQNWVAEMIPVILGIIFLVTSYYKFRFTTFAYIVMAIWVFMHTIGAKYSFALVPIDLFDPDRNHFDRVSHFSIGFWAVGAAELALMRKWVNGRLIAFVFGVLFILSLAASYEIIEWWYAAFYGGDNGAAFLGSQGDIWDAQKDMLADTMGAISALIIWIYIYKEKE